MPRYVPPKGITPPQLTPFRKGHNLHQHAVTRELLKKAKKLAKDKSPEAMETLVDLMTCADPRVAYMAATAILDRGMGKPKEADSGEDNEAATKIDVTKLSPEQREQLRAILQLGTVAREQETAEITPDADSSRALPDGSTALPALAPPVIDGDATEIATDAPQNCSDDGEDPQ